jgi:hypothetical protein
MKKNKQQIEIVKFIYGFLIEYRRLPLLEEVCVELQLDLDKFEHENFALCKILQMGVR